MIERFKAKLPRLFRLVYTGQFKRGLADAIGIFESGEPDAWGRFHDYADKNKIRSRSLLYYLFLSLRIDGAYDPTAELIEQDLGNIRAAGVTEDEMRGAWFSKLVNDVQFDDVQYEIASAAIFSQLLDPGTCKLEEPLHGSAVNPDLTGAWRNKRIRIEVKRVDDMPPRREPNALSIVEEAEIPGGFDAQLNVPLILETEAKFIRRMIEQLYEHRTLQRGGTATVEGFRFTMGHPYLNTANHNSPLRSVSFNDEPEFRIVQPGVFSGPTISPTEQTMLDDAFPASGVVDGFANAHVNPAARLRSTKGERVYGDVKGKIRQCEEGAINIVILGLSAPHYDENDLTDGLLGSPFVLAKLGPREGPEMLQSRTGLGPFTAAAAVDALPPATETRFPGLIEMIRTEISEFAKVSGVLGLRLSAVRPLAVFRPNPNAAVPAPADAGEIILSKATGRSACELATNA